MLLERELVVDTLVDEALEVTAAAEELALEGAAATEELIDAFAEGLALEGAATAEELIDAFAEGSALDGALDAFAEEPALGGVVDAVGETGAGADPDEEPDAARAGTAAPARTRRWLSFILIRRPDEGLIWVA